MAFSSRSCTLYLPVPLARAVPSSAQLCLAMRCLGLYLSTCCLLPSLTLLVRYPYSTSIDYSASIFMTPGARARRRAGRRRSDPFINLSKNLRRDAGTSLFSTTPDQAAPHSRADPASDTRLARGEEWDGDRDGGNDARGGGGERAQLEPGMQSLRWARSHRRRDVAAKGTRGGASLPSTPAGVSTPTTHTDEGKPQSASQRRAETDRIDEEVELLNSAIAKGFDILSRRRNDAVSNAGGNIGSVVGSPRASMPLASPRTLRMSGKRIPSSTPDRDRGNALEWGTRTPGRLVVDHYTNLRPDVGGADNAKINANARSASGGERAGGKKSSHLGLSTNIAGQKMGIAEHALVETSMAGRSRGCVDLRGNRLDDATIGSALCEFWANAGWGDFHSGPTSDANDGTVLLDCGQNYLRTCVPSSIRTVLRAGCLTYLNLEENLLDGRSMCKDTASALVGPASSLRCLVLRRNALGEEGMEALASAFAEHRGATGGAKAQMLSLSLGWTEPGVHGSVRLLDSLSMNASIKNLDLSGFPLGEPHGTVLGALGRLLCDNRTLTHLDLSHTDLVAADHAETLEEALKDNHTLLGIHLQSTRLCLDELGWPMQNTGCCDDAPHTLDRAWRLENNVWRAYDAAARRGERPIGPSPGVGGNSAAGVGRLPAQSGGGGKRHGGSGCGAKGTNGMVHASCRQGCWICDGWEEVEFLYLANPYSLVEKLQKQESTDTGGGVDGDGDRDGGARVDVEHQGLQPNNGGKRTSSSVRRASAIAALDTATVPIYLVQRVGKQMSVNVHIDVLGWLPLDMERVDAVAAPVSVDDAKNATICFKCSVVLPPGERQYYFSIDSGMGVFTEASAGQPTVETRRLRTRRRQNVTNMGVGVAAKAAGAAGIAGAGGGTKGDEDDAAAAVEEPSSSTLPQGMDPPAVVNWRQVDPREGPLRIGDAKARPRTRPNFGMLLRVQTVSYLGWRYRDYRPIFVHDWEAISADLRNAMQHLHFHASEDEMDQVCEEMRDLMWKNYPLLYQLFKFYGASDVTNDDSFNCSMLEFSRLCHDLQILDPHTRISDIDIAYIATNAMAKGQHDHVTHALVRHEFLVALVRIAVHKFSAHHDLTAAAKFEKVCLQCLIPHSGVVVARANDSDDFHRFFINDNAMEALLRSHERRLRVVYDTAVAARTLREKGKVRAICITDFLHILRITGLFESRVTQGVIIAAYVEAVDVEVLGCQNMSFDAFQEAMAHAVVMMQRRGDFDDGDGDTGGDGGSGGGGGRAEGGNLHPGDRDTSSMALRALSSFLTLLLTNADK